MIDLGTVFARAVRREPNAVALVDGEARLTYAEWYEEIRRVAGGLAALGVGSGDHLVTALANRREMASLYWAAQLLGAIFTPFNWRASGAEMAYVLDDAEARLFVFEPRSEAAAGEAAATVGLAPERLIAVGDARPGGSFAALLDAAPFDGPAAPDPERDCLMLYTSGTTGRPKGVPRSHRAERAAAINCVAQLYLRHGDSTLGVMPLFHTMGVRSLIMATLLGGKFVAMASFDAGDALRLIARERISSLFLVPTMFHDMVHHPALAGQDVSSVRRIGYAGMSMTTGLTERCAALFRPDAFINFYGSSEIYTFSICDHLTEKPGCAGRAGIGQELRLVRPDPDHKAGPEDLVGPGEVGEVIAPMAGLEAFRGYWKRPDADAKAIRGGWYFTGDLGYLDPDGELYLVGRVDDMIISGGENIHPEEVEDVLDRCPEVRRAAVVGLPDERLGQKVVAFIEPATPDATAERLDEACLGSALARFKRPRAYVFVERIPTSGSGKLLRRFLRDGQYASLPGYRSTL